ncbi:MAG TPA: hypothetical protein VGC59_13505 [Solirubrobacteraceae bacterium]
MIGIAEQLIGTVLELALAACERTGHRWTLAVLLSGFVTFRG